MLCLNLFKEAKSTLSCSSVAISHRDNVMSLSSTGRLFHSRVWSSCREASVADLWLSAARHTCTRPMTWAGDVCIQDNSKRYDRIFDKKCVEGLGIVQEENMWLDFGGSLDILCDSGSPNSSVTCENQIETYALSNGTIADPLRTPVLLKLGSRPPSSQNVARQSGWLSYRQLGRLLVILIPTLTATI